MNEHIQKASTVLMQAMSTAVGHPVTGKQADEFYDLLEASGYTIIEKAGLDSIEASVENLARHMGIDSQKLKP